MIRACITGPQPVPLALEWVCGQRLSLPRVVLLNGEPVDGGSSHVQCTDAGEEHPPVVVALAQRGEPHTRAFGDTRSRVG